MSISTWGELKQVMENAGVSDDTPIVLARDEEGNGFSPWDGYSFGLYEPAVEIRGQWIGGEFYSDKDQDEASDDAVVAVCLWP